jgi:hypothetical protein
MQVPDCAIFMFPGMTVGRGNNGFSGRGFSENTKSEVVCMSVNENIQEANMLVSLFLDGEL